MELEQVLSRAVLGNPSVVQLGNMQWHIGLQLLPQGFGKVGHFLVRAGTMDEKPFKDLLIAKLWLLDLCQEFFDLRAGARGDWIIHGAIIPQRLRRVTLSVLCYTFRQPESCNDGGMI